MAVAGSFLSLFAVTRESLKTAALLVASLCLKEVLDVLLGELVLGIQFPHSEFH